MELFHAQPAQPQVGLTARVICKAHTEPNMNSVIRAQKQDGFNRKPFICLFSKNVLNVSSARHKHRPNKKVALLNWLSI